MEKKIINLIKEFGPLTGSEIKEKIDADGLIIWRSCKASKKLTIRAIGTRYLRLDRRVDGYARLSPSILREFLTYSVVGLRDNPSPIELKSTELMSHIEEINSQKLELVYRTVSSLATSFDTELSISNEACFIIGGDIVYNMAHDVPRPERSTGKMVRGSDMDIVVIVDDSSSESFLKRLDDAIYQEKYRLLITPHLREEIDYIVKRMGRVREQICFDSFKRMVACKILQEGTLLFGSEEIFHTVKRMLREHGITERIKDLESRACIFRKKAEEYLLNEEPDKIKKENLYLFYPSEESEEFE